MDTAHIYVYGIIDFWQDDHAGEWGLVNLKDIKNQYEAQKNAKDITVHIHSEGGAVTEGFAIHDFLRAQGKPVKTIIEGTCASIATVIALAGDTRVMTTNANFFIHNPWGVAGGDKEEIQKYADELERMENQIADFYASKTKLSKDEALSLMKGETNFTASEALEKGFITEIATVMRAVALLNKKQKPMAKEAVTKEDVQGMFAALGKKIDTLLKPSKKKMLLVQDANGAEIDFPDVAEGETPAVGDKATVDGSPAEGEYTLPDSTVYVFAAGELTEIKPAEAEEEDEEMEALKTENEELKTEVAALKAQAKDHEKEAKKNLEAIKALQTDFNKLKDLAGDFKFDGKKKDTRTGEGESAAKRKL